MEPAAAGCGGLRCLKMRCGGYAPGGAAACGIVPATVPPEGLPRCLQLRRRSELRFVFMRLIAGSEIAAVGRADLRHVVIVFAPCIIAAAACDVSCLPSTLCVLWFFFGAADEKHRRRYANATLHGCPLDRGLELMQTRACCGQTPPFLIRG
jgi:hypothetical protein